MNTISKQYYKNRIAQKFQKNGIRSRYRLKKVPFLIKIDLANNIGSIHM